MKTIAIDFDGVIHKYSKGWQDGDIYDKPNEGAFEYLNELLSGENSVFIFSTRSPRQIKQWLKRHSNYLLYMSEADFIDQFAPMSNYDEKFVEREYQNKKQLQYKVEIVPFWKKFWNKKGILGITKRKLPAIAYIDDRAVKFTDFESLPTKF